MGLQPGSRPIRVVPLPEPEPIREPAPKPEPVKVPA